MRARCSCPSHMDPGHHSGLRVRGRVGNMEYRQASVPDLPQGFSWRDRDSYSTVGSGLRWEGKGAMGVKRRKHLRELGQPGGLPGGGASHFHGLKRHFRSLLVKKGGGWCSRQCAQNRTLGVTGGWSVWLEGVAGAGVGGSVQVGLMKVGM